MTLSAPTKLMFWLSVLAVVLAIIAYFVPAAQVIGASTTLILGLVGYVLLALGVVLKGL